MYFQREKVVECYFASVELNFVSLVFVLSEKPLICHHCDTMFQINNRIARCTSMENFSGYRKFQPSSYYGLGCEPITEIETIRPHP